MHKSGHVTPRSKPVHIYFFDLYSAPTDIQYKDSEKLLIYYRRSCMGYSVWLWLFRRSFMGYYVWLWLFRRLCMGYSVWLWLFRRSFMGYYVWLWLFRRSCMGYSVWFWLFRHSCMWYSVWLWLFRRSCMGYSVWLWFLSQHMRMKWSVNCVVKIKWISVQVSLLLINSMFHWILNDKFRDISNEVNF